MAMVHSVPSQKTREALFQTLVKAFRLEETILVFGNYSGNQKFSLKQQERINRVDDLGVCGPTTLVQLVHANKQRLFC